MLKYRQKHDIIHSDKTSPLDTFCKNHAHVVLRTTQLVKLIEKHPGKGGTADHKLFARSKAMRGQKGYDYDALAAEVATFMARSKADQSNEREALKKAVTDA